MNNKIDDLYKNDAVWAAFYRDGMSLGEICKEFDCGIYDVSPWLTKPLLNSINDAVSSNDGLPTGHSILEQADMPDGSRIANRQGHFRGRIRTNSSCR